MQPPELAFALLQKAKSLQLLTLGVTGFPLKLPTRIASPPSVTGLWGLPPNTISGL